MYLRQWHLKLEIDVALRNVSCSSKLHIDGALTDHTQMININSGMIKFFINFTMDSNFCLWRNLHPKPFIMINLNCN